MGLSRKEFAELRAPFVADSLRLYAEGFGAKAIAKRIGTTHKIVIKILKKEGVYEPGKLIYGEMHKMQTAHNLNAKMPAWRVEEIKRKDKKRKGRTYRVSDLPLFIEASKVRARLKGRRSSLTIEQRIRDRKNELERYHNDIQFRVKLLLRKRVCRVVKRENKSKRTMEMLGIDLDGFLSYMESKWQEGMTWENHGNGVNGWHIDHIRPCASFDLTNQDEIAQCFHYTNLQPLWAVDNLSKSSSWMGRKYRKERSKASQ